VRVAIDRGVDVLAHAVPESPPWASDFTEQLKRANLSLIPTLTLFDVETRKANVPDQQRTALLPKMVDQLRAYSEPGGDILFERISGMPTSTTRRWNSLSCRRLAWTIGKFSRLSLQIQRESSEIPTAAASQRT
jgi:hypothetical protein